MKKIDEMLSGMFVSEDKMCFGIREGGKIFWLDEPKMMKSLLCPTCGSILLNNCLLNDASDKSHLRVAFCAHLPEICLRPRTKYMPTTTLPTVIDWSSKGVPDAYLEKNISNYNFKSNQFKQTCYAFLAPSERQCWLFSGVSRTGKTHLSIALGKEFEEKTRNRMFFLTHSNLYFELKEAEKQLQLIERYERIPFLILDDLGVLRGTAMENDLTYELISRRLNRNCKTIITTNCTPDELKKQYGDRLMARLGEKGGIIEFTENAQNRATNDWDL